MRGTSTQKKSRKKQTPWWIKAEMDSEVYRRLGGQGITVNKEAVLTVKLKNYINKGE